jgi:hypothetical protein
MQLRNPLRPRGTGRTLGNDLLPAERRNANPTRCQLWQPVAAGQQSRAARDSWLESPVFQAFARAAGGFQETLVNRGPARRQVENEEKYYFFRDI